MPLLDIATAQASLQNPLGPVRAQSHVHCKVLSCPFTFCDDKRLSSLGKSIEFPRKVNAFERGKLQIMAVAIFEPKSLAPKEHGKTSCCENEQLGNNSDTSALQTSEDSMALVDREKLRRNRISKANRGNTPWNKGRKHSPETIQKIRERTKLAMQDPKIKMKLANLGHAQSKRTRVKIGLGVKLGWQKRREKQMMQEAFYFEWQNLIADASRKGCVGEEELQWNSYNIESQRLELEWVESVEQRKKMPRPKGSKRAPKSPEQRRKIAEAIAAKWADPEYRERVYSGLTKYHGRPVGVEGKRRMRPAAGTESTKRESARKRTSYSENSSGSETTTPIQRLRLQRSKKPLYKDPLASSKLKMIKNIRAERAVTETKKNEAFERARSLIAEAEKAANALEVAARKNPIARASLIETRKLIAEAIQSIESVDPENSVTSDDAKCSSLAPTEQVGEFEKEIDLGKRGCDQVELRELNGTKFLPTSNDEDLNFSNLAFHDILNGGQKFLPISSSGCGLPSLNLDSLADQSCSGKQPDQVEPNGSLESEKIINPPNGSKLQFVKEETLPKSVTKKWVRGKLVEATEGD